jgi:hypothetical protein
MDFFKRLHDFHDHVKNLKAQQQQMKQVESSQIANTLDSLDTQLRLITGPLAEERVFVENELASIEGNFFAAERDRVREK